MMTDHALLMAKQIMSVRNDRRKYFNQAMFDEHAWDMMLILYVAGEEGYVVNKQMISEETHTPPSTLDRWVHVLTAQHVVHVASWPHEHLQLTADARTRMHELLTQSFRSEN